MVLMYYVLRYSTYYKVIDILRRDSSIGKPVHLFNTTAQNPMLYTNIIYLIGWI